MNLVRLVTWAEAIVVESDNPDRVVVDCVHGAGDIVLGVGRERPDQLPVVLRTSLGERCGGENICSRMLLKGTARRFL